VTGPARLWELTSKKGWVRTECDLRIWIPCPVGFPEGLDRESWAAESARLRLEEAGVRKSDAVHALASMLAMIHRDSYADVPCHQIWIYLPTVTTLPLPVYVGIWEMRGGREEQLRELSGAADPQVVRAPVVEDFSARGLGSGLRALRYRKLEADTIYGVLGYAFRSEAYETDVQVWASTPNLPQLQAAVPDIDALIQGMTVFPAEDLAG
jgi:hypothetical protein